MAGAVAWPAGAHAVRTGPGRVGDRVDCGALPAGQGPHRATLRHPAGSSGEGDASAADRHAGAGQPFSADDLLALLAAAFCRARGHGGQRPPPAAAHPTAGRNSQLTRDAHGSCRSHRELAGPVLGTATGTGLRRITRGACRNRTTFGRFALAALSRPLPAAAPLPGRAAICKSFRPTASRTCRCKTQNLTPDQNQIHSATGSPLEKADISTW